MQVKKTGGDRKGADQEIAVRVIASSQGEGDGDDLSAVAVMAAHVINTRSLGGRALGKAVSTLSALPPWLSPLNGLLRTSIRNGLFLLELLPSRRHFHWLTRRRPAAPPRRAERIDVA